MQLTFLDVTGNDEVYMDCLRAICGETEGKSMLDAMSNLAPHTPKLGFKDRTYVDIFNRRLDHEAEQQYFINENIWHYIYKNADKRFDTIICSDGIEHIKKEEGFDLLKAFSFMSDRHVIFTPLGEYMMDDSDNPESHSSGWLPSDIPNYASIVLPRYHPTLNIGAFFAWYCNDIKKDFQRVSNELKQKSWARN